MEPHDATLQTPLVVSEQDMVHAAVYRMADGEVALFSTRSPGKLTPNEDSAALLPVDAHTAVLVVADGVGGGVSGEQASRLTVTTLRRALLEQQREGIPLRTALLDGIERANDAVLQLGMDTATTLAAVEISRHALRSFHVGDSMIMVTGQRGRVKFETVSHSPVGYAVAAGILGAHEAMHHADRHLVSNVVGSPEMHIDVGMYGTLARFDTLVLASDGLSDNLHRHEIVDAIRKGSLARAIQRLADEALSRMQRPEGVNPSKPDDLTIILYRRCR